MVALILTESYGPGPRQGGSRGGIAGGITPFFLLFCLVSLPMYIMSGQFGSTYAVYANERV